MISNWKTPIYLINLVEYFKFFTPNSLYIFKKKADRLNIVIPSISNNNLFLFIIFFRVCFIKIHYKVSC